MPLSPQASRRALMVAAFAFLAIALALMLWNRGIAHLLAMLAVLLAVGLARRARSIATRAHPSAIIVNDAVAPKPAYWYVGGILLASTVGAYWFLNYADRHNYTSAFPVYLFAISVGAAAWWLFRLLARWL
jgi:hypothetical protein